METRDGVTQPSRGGGEKGKQNGGAEVLEVSDQGTKATNDSKDEEDTVSFGNFIVREPLIVCDTTSDAVKRIYKFGTGLDFFMIAVCTAGAIGAGVAMPLMFLVMGRIVGDLTSYFTPFTTVTKEQFMHAIEKNS
jgi:hypothetical protein